MPPLDTDTSGHQPYPSGLLSRIVAIHFPERRRFFGILYLVLDVSGGNFAWQSGPGGSVSDVPEPSLEVNPQDPGVIQLDEYENPDGNQSNSGFGGCLTYIPSQTGVVGFGPWPGDCALSSVQYGSWGSDAATAFRSVLKGEFSYMVYIKPSIDNSSCAPQPTQAAVAYQSVSGDGCFQEQEYFVSVSTTPANGFSGSGRSATYLFQIPVGDGIIEIDVKNLLDTFSHLSDHIGNGQSGGGTIRAFVYSTARQLITELNQIWDIYGDDLPRLDYDDGFSVNLGMDPGPDAAEGAPSANGTFYISVWQDTETSQIDNYGVPYHPFRVRILPEDQGYFRQEYIPEQPPQLLVGIV